MQPLTKKVISIFWLQFCSALPWTILGSTMQAWLASENIPIEMIGSIGLARLPYSIRFLWAPLLDRFSFFGFARRKGWFFFSNLGLIFCLYFFASFSPKKDLPLILLFSILIGFFGATQANTVDGFKIEAFEKKDIRFSAIYGSLGLKAGFITAGAGSLVLAEKVNWATTYHVLIGLILSSLFILFFLPDSEKKESENIWKTFKEPFIDFFKKDKIYATIAFLFFYKINILLAISLITKFFIDIGFSATQIATAKIGNIFFSTCGIFLGNFFLKRFSLYHCLWLFEILEMLAGTLLWVLACSQHNFSLFMLTIFLQDLTNGMGNCGYELFTMSLCIKHKYSSTHLVMINCLNALKRSLITWPAGILIAYSGWANFFLFSTICAIPSLILLARRRFGENT